MEADESPVGSGVGCSFCRRCLVGVATRDCDNIFSPLALTLVAFLRRAGSLGVLLFLFLLRRKVFVLCVLVDDALWRLSCADLGTSAGVVGLVWDASVRYLDKLVVIRSIFPDALGATTER